MTYATGSLVQARGREWVVLPDSTDDQLVLRPLGGTGDEIPGMFLSLEGADVRLPALPSVRRARAALPAVELSPVLWYLARSQPRSVDGFRKVHYVPYLAGWLKSCLFPSLLRSRNLRALGVEGIWYNKRRLVDAAGSDVHVETADSHYRTRRRRVRGPLP